MILINFEKAINRFEFEQIHLAETQISNGFTVLKNVYIHLLGLLSMSTTYVFDRLWRWDVKKFLVFAQSGSF